MFNAHTATIPRLLIVGAMIAIAAMLAASEAAAAKAPKCFGQRATIVGEKKEYRIDGTGP